MAKRKVYGYWDCEYCGAKGIRGDHRECTQCGNPRSAGVKFYIKDAKNPELIEKENLHKFSGQADWVCSYCNALNSANSTECKGCGASKADSERNYFTAHKATDVYDRKTGTWSTNENADEDVEISADNPFDNFDRSENFGTNSMGQGLAGFGYNGGMGNFNRHNNYGYNGRVVNRRNTKIPWVAISVIVGILAVIASIIYFVKASVVKTINVTDLIWLSEVHTEESYESFESGWSLPTGARLAYTRQEQDEVWVSGKKYVNYHGNIDLQAIVVQSLISNENVLLCQNLEQTDSRNVAIGLYDSDIYQHELVPLDFIDNGDGSFDWDDGSDDSYDYGNDDYDFGGGYDYDYDDDTDNGHWETVYKTKYYYYITRWRPLHTYTEMGTNQEAVYYKDDYKLSSNERVSSKTVEYTVVTHNGSYKASAAIWSKLEVGGTFKVKCGKFTNKNTILDVITES